MRRVDALENARVVLGRLPARDHQRCATPVQHLVVLRTVAIDLGGEVRPRVSHAAVDDEQDLDRWVGRHRANRSRRTGLAGENRPVVNTTG